MLYPWQTQQWAQCLQSWGQHKNTIPQTLLLAGPEGIGKASFAWHLAGFYLCHAPQADRPCGQCRACLLFKAQSHPDVHSLSLEGKNKVIKVDAVRQWCADLHQKAQQGHGRVGIINALDALNKSSANSLLKLLEEPADQVLLLLLYHQTVPLMPTISTRCYRIPFPVPNHAESWLKNQLTDAHPQEIKQLLSRACGAPLTALALAKTDELAMLDRLLRVLHDQGSSEDDNHIKLWIKTAGFAHLLDGWMYMLHHRLWGEAGYSWDFLSQFWAVLLKAKEDWMLSQGNLHADMQYEALLAHWYGGLNGSKANTVS